MPIAQFLKRLSLAGMCLTGLTAVTTNIFATPLPITDSGILQIGGLQGALVGVTSAPPCISWSGSPTCSGFTAHQMAVSGSSNLFSTSASATDTIKDLPSFPPPTLTDFETVLGAGTLAGQTIHFDLAHVFVNGPTNVGNCSSNAALNSCTPANSPFTFSMDSTGQQLTISFSVLMDAYTGTNSTFTQYLGVFSTQQSGHFAGFGSCANAVADITDALTCESTQGTITATWSATESPLAGTPEPMSLALFGSGLIGLGLIGRRFRRS